VSPLQVGLDTHAVPVDVEANSPRPFFFGYSVSGFDSVPGR